MGILGTGHKHEQDRTGQGRAGQKHTVAALGLLPLGDTSALGRLGGIFGGGQWWRGYLLDGAPDGRTLPRRLQHERG